jgi:hypothetical protein
VVTNGSAVQTYPWVRLTGAAPDQAGSLFTTTPLDVTGFATRLAFRLEGPDYSPNPGAGIAFVLQGVGPAAVGAAGGGLGYQGIGQSAAATFDLATNSIGLVTNGSAPAGTVTLAGTGIDLRSGHDLQADLFYDGATLTVSLTDVATGATAPPAVFPVDIPGLVGGGTAYVGFTGATGPTVDRFGSQTLAAWRYRAVPPGTPNQPPVIVRPARVVAPVDYGVLELPLQTSFQVRAEDDGGPPELRTRWELMSAPPGAIVQFDPLGRNGPRFFESGTYVFRLTATDAQGLSATSEATFVVRPAGTLEVPIPFWD